MMNQKPNFFGLRGTKHPLLLYNLFLPYKLVEIKACLDPFFLDLDTVALSFIFNKYYLTII